MEFMCSQWGLVLSPFFVSFLLLGNIHSVLALAVRSFDLDQVIDSYDHFPNLGIVPSCTDFDGSFIKRASNSSSCLL